MNVSQSRSMEADEDGGRPDTDLFGCNHLVSSISRGCHILPTEDLVVSGGLVKMVIMMGPTFIPYTPPSVKLNESTDVSGMSSTVTYY